jgi:hypothetical protein
MPSTIATPQTFTSDPSAGTVAWASPTRALTSNDNYTVASLAANESSQRLRGVEADFSGIPANAAIVGIEVRVEATADISGGGVFEFAEVSLVVAGSAAGDNRGGAVMEDGGDTDSLYTFGGAADLWGLSLTVPQVQAADFGCVVRVAETGGEIEAAAVSIDHVQIRVHYSERSAASRTSLAVGIGVGM